MAHFAICKCIAEMGRRQCSAVSILVEGSKFNLQNLQLKRIIDMYEGKDLYMKQV